ncbi:MAG: M20/M25/M40 family metallo-hydrolase, partial [Isosphaeraceae bacterium]
VNAIYRMAAVVSALAEHARELSGDTPHPVLGPPSLSVGRIEGGQSVNVVPDWCEVEIDRRVIPGETPADGIARVEQALKSRLGGLDGIEFLPPWVKMPALSAERSGSDRWLDPLRDAVRRATGQIPQVTGVPYGTDAGPLGEGGLAAVVFGPGDIAQAHTKDEWLDLEQLNLATEAYYQMACVCGA